MKIRLFSDLHLEMPYNKAPESSHPFVYEYKGEDVVVLAGDIHTQNRHEEIISHMILQVPHVIMVAGNHEAYGTSFSDVHYGMTELENIYPNFHYLSNESIYIGGVEFFGGTMFTALEGTDIDNLCEKYIPDFRVIMKGLSFDSYNDVWTTADHRNEHEKFCQHLKAWKQMDFGGNKRVVISHFLPTEKAIAPQFVASALNPYFVQDMEAYMNGVDLWLFGHTHTSFDFNINETRLVSNPYGYGDENMKEFNTDLIIEI